MRPVSRRYRCGVEAHEEDRPKVADRCVSGSRRLHKSQSLLGGVGECWGADLTLWPAVCACARGWVGVRSWAGRRAADELGWRRGK
jgi:hypothetical protein